MHRFIKKFFLNIPFFLGVTLITYFFTSYFSVDPSALLKSSNSSLEELEHIQFFLSSRQNLSAGYLNYLREIFSLDFGHSLMTQEAVTDIMKKAVPISLSLTLPAFFLGNLGALAAALVSAFFRQRWPDWIISTLCTTAIGTSFVIVVMSVQIVFCSSSVLNACPINGWEVHDLRSYLTYSLVPSLALSLIVIGYNTKYFRILLIEELYKPYVKTLSSLGIRPIKIYLKHVLGNVGMPILNRALLTSPNTLLGGSLLIESFFGIPGIGSITFDALKTGDIPLLKAILACSSLLYLLLYSCLFAADEWMDPRVKL